MIVDRRFPGKPLLFLPGRAGAACAWCGHPWSSVSAEKGRGWCVRCSIVLCGEAEPAAQPIYGPRHVLMGHWELTDAGVVKVLYTPPLPFCPQCGGDWTAVGDRGAICVPCGVIGGEPNAVLDARERRGLGVQAVSKQATTKARTRRVIAE